MQRSLGRREVLGGTGTLVLASFSGCLGSERNENYRPGTVVVTTEKREPTAAEVWAIQTAASPDTGISTPTGPTSTPPKGEPKTRSEPGTPSESSPTQTSTQATPVVLEETVAVDRENPAVITGLVGETGSYVVQARSDGEHFITDFEVGPPVADTYLRISIGEDAITSAVHTVTPDQ